MSFILEYLMRVPDYVWQIVALFLPGNKLFQFIHGKLTAPVSATP